MMNMALNAVYDWDGKSSPFIIAVLVVLVHLVLVHEK